jgi:hypothetical protein
MKRIISGCKLFFKKIQLGFKSEFQSDAAKEALRWKSFFSNGTMF